MTGGDNRETIAQAMFGKSEDDLEREEQVELKRLIQGKPGTQEQHIGALLDSKNSVAEPEDAEHAAAVRAEDNTDYADSLHRPTRERLPNDQLASTGRMDADDVRREYPASRESAQSATQAAVSDKKPSLNA